ncbi:MAG: hypothetical protein LBC60_00980, partial [Spirochaetaceae bacterium]|nr:hypothetical protein [Spirochaetaceae bacterium]
MRNHECNQRMYLFSGWLIASFLMLCAVGAIIAGCALPVGDDYRIKRNTSNPFVIGTYDLQVYVPVPVAGSEPVTVLHRGDLDVQVTWKDAADNDLTGSLDSFQVGEVYRADITINTKKGWLFDPARNFQYPEGSVSIQPGPNADTLVRSLATVTYLATEAPKMVDQVDLSLYIPVPVLEATPVGSFWAEQYTGTVKWSGGPETEPLDLFQGGVIYTAELSLAAAPGYVFGTSLGFYHTGDNLSPDPAALAFTAAPDSSGGTLSIVFPKTRAGTDIALPIDLTEHISAPVAEATARTSFISPSMQFSGSVIWKDRSGAPMSGDVFRGEEIYIAEVALTAAPGFVFPGNITGDDFHHQYDDSYIPPVYTPGNGETGTVTLTFPMTPDLIGVNDYDLQNYLPLPEAGVMPVWELDRGGVMGTVSWDYYVPSHGYTAMSQLEVFRCDTVYRAEITMRVKAGYIFNSGHTFDYAAGLHWGPAGNSNGKKIRSFTVVYEEPIGSFASEPTPGSALKRIRAAKARGEFTSV